MHFKKAPLPEHNPLVITHRAGRSRKRPLNQQNRTETLFGQRQRCVIWTTQTIRLTEHRHERPAHYQPQPIRENRDRH